MSVCPQGVVVLAAFEDANGNFTGRKALYFDSTTTLGSMMDEASGSALLLEICEFATQPQFLNWRHCQIGDALLWDSCFMMHRREPFDPSRRRLMKRTTIFLLSAI